MKRILALSLIWTLLSTAGALQCLSCTDAQCSSQTQQTCSTEAACVTASIQGSIYQTTGQNLVKKCADASVCPAVGSSTFSVSTSGLSALIAIQCCSTDNCNSATPTLPGPQATNGLQCFSCDVTNGNCSSRIQCKGIEDRCFRSEVTVGATTSKTWGCASANLCAAGSSVAPSLPNIVCCSTNLCAAGSSIAPTVVQTVSKPTSCSTKLCNSAPASGASLLLGLLGLLVFSLY